MSIPAGFRLNVELPIPFDGWGRMEVEFLCADERVAIELGGRSICPTLTPIADTGRHPSPNVGIGLLIEILSRRGAQMLNCPISILQGLWTHLIRGALEPETPLPQGPASKFLRA